MPVEGGGLLLCSATVGLFYSHSQLAQLLECNLDMATGSEGKLNSNVELFKKWPSYASCSMEGVV